MQFASEHLKSDFSFLSELMENFGTSVLEYVNLLDIYDDLKLKNEMDQDLKLLKANKSKLRKF